MSPSNVLEPWRANEAVGYVTANDILRPLLPYIACSIGNSINWFCEEKGGKLPFAAIVKKSLLVKA